MSQTIELTKDGRTLVIKTVRVETASGAGLIPLEVVDIDNPSAELNAIGGTLKGDTRLCYQELANRDLWTLYVWDDVDGSAEDVPYRADGITGMWCAIAGRNHCDGLLASGDLTAFGNTAMQINVGLQTLENTSTGVIKSDGLSFGSPGTDVDIAAGRGHIVDIHTNPTTPTIKEVPWEATSLTISDLTDFQLTWIHIDGDGNPQQRTTPPTSEQLRDELHLGFVAAFNGVLLRVENRPYIAASIGVQFATLFDAVGTINESVAVSNGGTDLTLASTGGQLKVRGGNFRATAASRADPNTNTISSGNPIGFFLLTQNDSTVVLATDVDPGNYDVAGVVTPIPGSINRATNQRIWLFPDGLYGIQYGTIFYNSVTDAVSASATEAFVDHPVFSETRAVLLATMSIRKGAANLSLDSDVRFLPGGKFGEAGVGGSGQSVTSIQQAYNNSLDGKITTDTTREAVKFQRGTAADTDDVVEVLNGAGAQTAGITGAGIATITGIGLGGHTLSDVLISTDGASVSDVSLITAGWATANIVGAAHSLGGASHTADTLANLNSKISDATLIDTGDARLSDARTPTSHSLGGSEHAADTLANLNLKVSDATLIDTGDSRLSDSRTPTAHAFAGALHTADTLANLNTKVSDATLIDTGDARLSDARTPTSHGLGGSEHATATLAQLNAKVSDATLIDTTDARLSDDRDPNAHDLAGADHNTATLTQLSAKVSDATLARIDASQTFSGAQTFDTSITLGGNTVSDIFISTDDASTSDAALVTAGWVAANTGDPDVISLARIAGSTFFSLQHLQDVFHSAGWVSGGGITDDTDGTITVVAGTGLIRATDSSVAEMPFFDWASEAGANVALTDNSMHWIYAEYNGGTPRVVSSLTERTDFQTNVLLGTVYRIGTTLHIAEANKHQVGDHAGQMIRRQKDVMPFAHTSGGVIGETGTRNIILTAGSWWQGLTEFATSAVDTSAAGTFQYLYQSAPSAWAIVSSTQIDNLQYNNGTSGLATLSNNQYGVHWVYLQQDDEFSIVYGAASYTLQDAENAGVPTALPPWFSEDHARLIGRIIIKKNAATFELIESTFETTFSGATPTDHSSLLNLIADDHTQYVLVDGTRSMTGNLTAPGLVLGGNAVTDTLISSDGASSSDTAFVTAGWIDANISDITDHGGLGGLSDDDHTQYLLIDGSRAMTGILTGVGAIHTINAIGVAETVGILAVNTTDAAAGAQQFGPMFVQQGSGWKTDATAAPQEVKFAQQVQTIQGAANPTGELVFKASIENVSAGAYAEVARFSSDGQWLKPDGSATAPSSSFSGDRDLGIYRHSANALGFTGGGILRYIMSVLQFRITANGTESGPSLVVGRDDFDSGLWSPASDIVALSTGGTEAARWDASQVQINAAGIKANEDNDEAFIFGHARIDSRVTDVAYFSHYDRGGTAEFALSQTTAGVTKLNATTFGAFTIAGVDKYNWTADAIQTNTTGGFGLRHEVSTSTNPTLTPYWNDADAGVGGASGTPAMITNNVTRQHWSQNTTGLPVSTIFRDDVGVVEAGETVGLRLANTTDAADVAQQWSPMFEFEGQGWKEPPTSATQEVLFAMQLETVQGVVNPTGDLVWKSNINDAGYVDRMVLNSAGDLKITGDLDHDGSLVGFYATAPVAQSSAYTPTNVTPDRSFDADTVAIAELADIVGTIIADIQATGLLG